MKPPVDRATTRRVLAGIDSVLRERTAAAVDRTLRTASPGVYEGTWGRLQTAELYEGLGVSRAVSVPCLADCDACDDEVCPTSDIPGLTYYLDQSLVPDRQRRRYAPEAVSPHLFGGAL